MTAGDDDGHLDAVFAALADPTRRLVVRRLLDGGPGTASGLARELPITRQAVAKHLQALADARLVEPRREGREVRYEATPGALSGAVEWMVETGARWDQRLGRLQRLLARPPG